VEDSDGEEEEDRPLTPEEIARCTPPAPYPEALRNPVRRKNDATVEDILELFKQVKMNIPLVESLEQVPTYAKDFKNLVTKKRRSKNSISNELYLDQNVCSILMGLPKKRQDPGMLVVACTIGDSLIEGCLLDLGASVNILPYSLYLELGLEELQPFNKTLQLADKSDRVPKGIVEDVLIKVDEFYFPVDFVVLDMDPVDKVKRKIQVPLILGRPFLNTGNALINCRSGRMEISFGNKKAYLTVFKTPGKHNKGEDCYMLEQIDIQESTKGYMDKGEDKFEALPGRHLCPHRKKYSHNYLHNGMFQWFPDNLTPLLEEPDNIDSDLSLGSLDIRLNDKILKNDDQWLRLLMEIQNYEGAIGNEVLFFEEPP